MSSATNQAPSRKFIKIIHVKELYSRSTSEVYRRIAASIPPKQITLGPKCVVWIEAEVLAWLDARIAESCGERGRADILEAKLQRICRNMPTISLSTLDNADPAFR
ncbi:helix-turn-helix transcriptional regulator [Pseudomonas marginalis]